MDIDYEYAFFKGVVIGFIILFGIGFLMIAFS